MIRVKRKKYRLKLHDFYMAKSSFYLDAHPEVRQALIENEKEYPPKECVECMFFSWVFGEDKRIRGGTCAAKPEIEEDKFGYWKVAEGCPLRE